MQRLCPREVTVEFPERSACSPNGRRSVVERPWCSEYAPRADKAQQGICVLRVHVQRCIEYLGRVRGGVILRALLVGPEGSSGPLPQRGVVMRDRGVRATNRRDT